MGILPYPASSLWTAAPNAIEKFLGAHPAALKFVQTPKPIPTSFGKESLFAVSAFKFTNADGVSRYGRYRVLPVGGNEYLDEAAAAARSQNCLFDEIKERVAKEPVKFHIVVQLAEDGDTVDDATVRWPEDRPQLTFGEISLRETTPNNASEQQRIIFDPIPRVDGIEASADPLLREDSRESRFPASPSGSWCLINQLPREGWATRFQISWTFYFNAPGGFMVEGLH